MKKNFINAIKAGDFIEDIFVLTDKSMSQKKDGDYFLNITLADKTGQIKGVIWDNTEKINESISRYDIVLVNGTVTEYRGTFQIVIKKITECTKENIDIADFVPTTQRNINSMYRKLLKITESIKNEHLKKLLEEFWVDEAFVQSFKKAPGAKKLHHAYLGGLLEHTLSMALLIERIAGHYSKIDIDLLMTSAILHDIGKIREYDYKFIIDYSDEGRLLSHIVIGLQMIDDKIKKIKDFPEETAVLLRHMIVSHHGTREFGSPEPPKTIEAILLNYIDDIDSKVNGIKEFMMAAENKNECWTSFHPTMERYFYIGNNNNKEKTISSCL